MALQLLRDHTPHLRLAVHLKPLHGALVLGELVALLDRQAPRLRREVHVVDLVLDLALDHLRQDVALDLLHPLREPDPAEVQQVVRAEAEPLLLGDGEHLVVAHVPLEHGLQLALALLVQIARDGLLELLLEHARVLVQRVDAPGPAVECVEALVEDLAEFGLHLAPLGLEVPEEAHAVEVLPLLGLEVGELGERDGAVLVVRVGVFVDEHDQRGVHLLTGLDADVRGGALGMDRNAVSSGLDGTAGRSAHVPVCLRTTLTSAGMAKNAGRAHGKTAPCAALVVISETLVALEGGRSSGVAG
ncbi:hypothetical protein DENSPDRAFT_285474 [Dentipellis sp. KUC8613]|nr:hypothetical protein DENSPDRAFT_285474 [Dentipellis sp. KUC8613]